MEFDDLRAFVSVADTGSVSLAAQNLHVTQSALTRRLQRLESALGTTLLDRRTRPVMLTGAGQAALERCRRVLNDVREVQAMTSNAESPRGVMRIGVAHALTEFTLSEPVGTIREKFPQVSLRLGTGWSRDLRERVRGGAIDAAVILLPALEPLPNEVSGKKVGEERFVLVGPRRHRSIRKLQDLDGVQWILNPEGCGARSALRKVLARANLDMVVAVEAYNYDLQLMLVAQNRGLSLVPEHILERCRIRSRLRTFEITGLEFPLTIWTVYRRPLAGLDPVISELARILVAKF